MSELAGVRVDLTIEKIAAALGDHGLCPRGSMNFDRGEAAPRGPSGKPARSVLLVGNAGGAHWPHFEKWCQCQAHSIANPLDFWARVVIGGVAKAFSARAVSPSDRPYLPFQQWAMRAEGLKPSPLGILMHPEYGLWHAYRGALLFDVDLEIPIPDQPVHLCDRCVEKPCLKKCPVDANSEVGFAHERCLAHVRAPDGVKCSTDGCLDRNACPYGAAYRYAPSQQAFHMAAFAGAAPQIVVTN